ncbi:MAG: helix-turn-helix domain-containing protein [Turicibacter sp.]
MEYVSNTLEETVTHGDLMFQLNIYDDKLINPSNGLYTHWHEEVEMVYVKQGPFILTINGQDFIANTGDCFIINSHDIHHARSYNEHDSLHYAIVFNLNLLKSFQFDSCQHKYIDPLMNGQIQFPSFIDTKTPEGIVIKNNLETIRCLSIEKPFGWELALKTYLFQILVTLLLANRMEISTSDQSRVKNPQLILVKTALEFLHAHYQEHIIISDIAKSISISTEYFCRIFKLFTGKTPVEYLNDFRINQAAHLLISTNLSILDIAIECGFENTSYFIKKFKLQKGTTPKQFKKLYSHESL